MASNDEGSMSKDDEPTANDDEASFPISARSKIRRLSKFGSYSRADVYRILDASPLCHVGYVVDGSPFVTPTLQWRIENTVYWHGSIASRFLEHANGCTVCVTCTLMDGYVLARSAFNHAVNYRSAMVFGIARVLTDREVKTGALRNLTNGLFPNRWETLRPMDETEVNATSILCLDIEEATVKSRTGPPADIEEAHIPVWSGVIPVSTRLATPEPAPELPKSITLPEGLEKLVASGQLRKI